MPRMNKDQDQETLRRIRCSTGLDYLDPDAGPIYLRRVRLNSGGYDAGGAYWGLGIPLFCAQDQGGNTLMFRAYDRQEAKALLCADYDAEMRFYR